jgi:hypothetical protein
VDAVRAAVLVSLGRADEARSIAERLHLLWQRGDFASQLLAKLYARLGEGPRAIALLRGGIERKEASVIGALLNPAFRQLFDDPEFVALARGVGLDPSLLKAYR